MTNRQEPSHEPVSGGPLAGVEVVEVASVLMAPLASRYLAKLGARVIRVEPPTGDVIRRSGAARNPGMTGANMSFGDGKENIAIDLNSDEGQRELEGLITDCDIIITNHPPTRRTRFGLDWESVRHVNPAAILCTAQGYASTSKYADRPAYDDTIQAATGVCDLYRRRSGTPEYSPYVIADKVVGLTIVYSALAALHHRSQTGQGQWVDVPMMDVMADFNLLEQLNDFTFIPPLGPPGWHRTLTPARRPHATQDGWVCVMPYTDRNWVDFASLAGVDANELPTLRDRNASPEVVHEIISTYAAARTTQQVVQECQSQRIPVEPVASVESLVEDPYLRGRGTVQSYNHPTEGRMWRTTPNISFSASPLPETDPAGRLDENRHDIF